MLRDRITISVVAIIGLVLTVLLRRQIEGFPDTQILNIINIIVVVVICFLIVIIARAWLPGRYPR